MRKILIMALGILAVSLSAFPQTEGDHNRIIHGFSASYLLFPLDNSSDDVHGIGVNYDFSMPISQSRFHFRTGIGFSHSYLHDFNNLFDKTIANLYTQTKDDGHFDKISHSAIVSKDDEIMMSFGPNDYYKPEKWKGFLLSVRPSTAEYDTHISNTSLVSKDLYLNKHLFSALRKISKYVPYQGLTSNCVNWSSLGLLLNGIPNIGIHPFLLHASVSIYNTGIYNNLATQLISF